MWIEFSIIAISLLAIIYVFMYYTSRKFSLVKIVYKNVDETDGVYVYTISVLVETEAGNKIKTMVVSAEAYKYYNIGDLIVYPV